MLLLWILVLLLGAAYLAHRRIAALPALGVVALYLLAMGTLGHAPGGLMLVLWLVLAAVAVPWRTVQWPPGLGQAAGLSQGAIDRGRTGLHRRPDRRTLRHGQRLADRPGHGPAPRSLGPYQAARFLCPDHPQGIWRQGFLRLRPLPGGDETGDPQRRPGVYRHGPQLPRPGGTAAALRHRSPTRPLPATPGSRRRHPLLRPDRATGRFRCGGDAGHRGHLQGRMERRASAGTALELGEALYHPRPRRHPARPGVQGP